MCSVLESLDFGMRLGHSKKMPQLRQTWIGLTLSPETSEESQIRDMELLEMCRAYAEVRWHWHPKISLGSVSTTCWVMVLCESTVHALSHLIGVSYGFALFCSETRKSWRPHTFPYS